MTPEMGYADGFSRGQRDAQAGVPFEPNGGIQQVGFTFTGAHRIRLPRRSN